MRRLRCHKTRTPSSSSQHPSSPSPSCRQPSARLPRVTSLLPHRLLGLGRRFAASTSAREAKDTKSRPWHPDVSQVRQTGRQMNAFDARVRLEEPLVHFRLVHLQPTPYEQTRRRKSRRKNAFILLLSLPLSSLHFPPSLVFSSRHVLTPFSRTRSRQREYCWKTERRRSVFASHDPSLARTDPQGPSAASLPPLCIIRFTTHSRR